MSHTNMKLPTKIIFEGDTCSICGNAMENSDNICFRCRKTLNSTNFNSQSEFHALWLALRTAVKTGVVYVGVKSTDHSKLINVIPITDLNNEQVIFKAFPNMTVVTEGINYEETNIQGSKR